MLDKEKVREIASDFADRVRGILEPTAIIIFGSYINGNPHKDSDIDIAVIVKDFKGDWLETMGKLCGISWDVSFDIEAHLMDENHDRSGFVEHVKKTGEYVYKAA